MVSFHQSSLKACRVLILSCNEVILKFWLLSGLLAPKRVDYEPQLETWVFQTVLLLKEKSDYGEMYCTCPSKCFTDWFQFCRLLGDKGLNPVLQRHFFWTVEWICIPQWCLLISLILFSSSSLLVPLNFLCLPSAAALFSWFALLATVSHWW